MGTVYHGKLVRDLIPTIIESAGKTPVSELISLNEIGCEYGEYDHDDAY